MRKEIVRRNGPFHEDSKKPYEIELPDMGRQN
jgi:hypothetical protein